ncbi:MAG: DUF2256 domain-containing protein [Planctomycetaceae bacterium]
MVSRKHLLPEKICLTCSRPFQWRRRWARDWDNVKYCSERCRRSKPAGTLIPGESPADQKHPATQPARNRSRR